jgi:hypothetical protein
MKENLFVECKNLRAIKSGFKFQLCHKLAVSSGKVNSPLPVEFLQGSHSLNKAIEAK